MVDNQTNGGPSILSESQEAHGAHILSCLFGVNVLDTRYPSSCTLPGRHRKAGLTNADATVSENLLFEPTSGGGLGAGSKRLLLMLVWLRTDTPLLMLTL